MADFNALRIANVKRWRLATPTRDFKPDAEKLLANKARYQEVTKRTGVPWFVIAAIHNRESSLRFDCNLANGQPLNIVTTLVPKGRGPYKTWEDSAVDALPRISVEGWTLAGTLTFIERYNGVGYANRSLPSPYLWAGTSIYKSGKFVKDGVFDPRYVDQQLGCAGLIMALHELDPSVLFEDGWPLTVKKKTLRDRVQSFLNSISR